MKWNFYNYLACALVSVCLPALADDSDPSGEWPLCPYSLDIPARPHVAESLASDDIYITADQADLIEEEVSVLEGNVEVTRGEQQVSAEKMTYNQQTEIAEMEGDLEFWDNAIYFRSEYGQVDFSKKEGNFNKSHYKIRENRARGIADSIYHNDAEKYSDLSHVTYTTCDPEDNFWKFSASEIHLDHIEERGSARNVVLRIKDFPVFYTPYISFPLSDKRKTGFLIPRIGNSTRSGFDIQTPFYINIAPHMDATIAPRLLTDRGMMLVGEYRYLMKNGFGELDAEYLPSDSNFNDEDRNLISFEHEHRYGKTGKIFLDYNRVSDKQYFEDFGNNLNVTSTRYLLQQARTTYSGRWNIFNWNILGNLQNFQTVDRTLPATSRPYKRLPQFRFNARTPEQSHRLHFDLKSEIVYFDRDGIPLVPTSDVNGTRFDILPSLSYPMRTASTFLVPKLGVRYTQYALGDTGANTFDDNPYRLLPIASLDSGMFFERETSIFGKEIVQTLEPRAFYLLVPGENQSDLPVFDTNLFDFNFSSLFRENRFTGPDRLGDANQLTLGLTSRLLNFSTGRELGYLSLGSIIYFSDRNVILPDGIERDESSSPFVAEIGTSFFRDWNFMGNIQWDPHNSKTEKLTGAVQYHPESDKLINLSYRMRDTTNSLSSTSTQTNIEQTDVSLKWPLGQNWHIVGRWNYSLDARRSLDIFGGLEYESCCWGFRTIARRFLSDIDGDFETGIFFQVELKGLAGIGTKTTEFLEQNIRGYQSDF